MNNIKVESVNFSHLDNLCERVVKDNQTYRIVHIYAHKPDYAWKDDPVEGTSCVDDVARAAVVYLRDFELNGNTESAQKGEELLRFILYMQVETGFFYNFVINSNLEINREHPNSRADGFHWWSARAIWALGIGSNILKNKNPTLTADCIAAIKKIFPHIFECLKKYPQTEEYNGRDIPLWIINGYADLTAELILGLIPLNKVLQDNKIDLMIKHLAEGISMMQYGALNIFPYGLHSSDRDSWHGWGSSQTQALAEAGILESAVFEAKNFYPHLLVDGWWSNIPLDSKEDIKLFPCIAYSVRCVTLGLIRLYEATREKKYLQMAGLAGSWFHGNNMSGDPIYNHEHGHGYDGIDKGGNLNLNSGAESTIETLYTILELSNYAEAHKWSLSKSAPLGSKVEGGKEYRYRIYTLDKDGAPSESIAVIINLTDNRFKILLGEELTRFLGKQEIG